MRKIEGPTGFDAVVVTSVQGPISNEKKGPGPLHSHLFYPTSQRAVPLDFPLLAGEDDEGRLSDLAPEVADVIRRGRLRIVFAIDSPGGLTSYVELARAAVDRVRRGRGDVHSFAFTEISSSAANIWALAGRRHVLLRTQAMWHTPETQPDPLEHIIAQVVGEMFLEGKMGNLENEDFFKEFEARLTTQVVPDEETIRILAEMNQREDRMREEEERQNILRVFERVAQREREKIEGRVLDPLNPRGELHLTGRRLRELGVADTAFTGVLTAFKALQKTIGVRTDFAAVGLGHLQKLAENVGLNRLLRDLGYF